MDCDYIEEKIAYYNKVPCIFNPTKMTDIQDKITKYGRQIFVGDTITVRVPMFNPIKIPCAMGKLRVLYDCYAIAGSQFQESTDLLEIED